MPTALITHPACLAHDTGSYHPECPDRLRAVLAALETPEFLSAHIDGYGERAVDAFYVVGEDGLKLSDARKRNALKTALLAALEDAEDEVAPTAHRAHLQRARASVAR